ncbi:MAG TPA: signal peptidase I [Alphaproteobacteria bacterium]|nr:signal peptidase I [Alphaproteobacteria bacterium]
MSNSDKSWKDTSKKLWENFKYYARETWNFLWHEDSVWSWMASILIAFVLIKFLLYPAVGLYLGTELPVVAVISESMSHDGSFDEWWASPALCMDGNVQRMCTQEEWYSQRGITKEEFKNFRMSDGFNKGDIIILKGITFEELQVGDILVYDTKLSYPVIHRVVAKTDVIETKGDHNQNQLLDAKINERYISKDDIIGIAWVKIPYLGYVKILFAQLVQCVTFNGCYFGK